jgi:hypothetical protein
MMQQIFCKIIIILLVLINLQIPNTRQDRHGNASRGQSGRGYTKVDKEDPRSRLHYVKYMKKDGKTIKKWECGMCEYHLCMKKDGKTIKKWEYVMGANHQGKRRTLRSSPQKNKGSICEYC